MPKWNLVNVVYSDGESTSTIIRTELFDEFLNFCRGKKLVLLINSKRQATSATRIQDNIEDVLTIRCDIPKSDSHNFYELYLEFIQEFYLHRDLNENLFAGDIYEMIKESPERDLQRFGNKQTTFEQTTPDEIKIHVLEDTAITMLKGRKPIPIREVLQDRLIKSILNDHRTRANGTSIDPIDASKARDAEILVRLELLVENHTDILQKVLNGNCTILDLYIDCCEKQMVPVNKQILQKLMERGCLTCITIDPNTGNPIKNDIPVAPTVNDIEFFLINFNILVSCLSDEDNIPAVREGMACTFLSCMAQRDRQELLSASTHSMSTILDNYLKVCVEQHHPINHTFLNKLVGYGAVSTHGLHTLDGVTRAQLIKRTAAIDTAGINLDILIELMSARIRENIRVSKIRRLIKSLSPHKRYFKSIIDGKYTLLDLYLKYTHDNRRYFSKLVLESLLKNGSGLYIENGIPTSIDAIKKIMDEFSNDPAIYSDTVLLLSRLGLIVRNKGDFFIVAGKSCNYYKDCRLSEDPYSSPAIVVTYEQLKRDDDFLDQLFIEILCHGRRPDRLRALIKEIDARAIKKFTIGNYSLLDLYIIISIKNDKPVHADTILEFINKGVGLIFYNNAPSSLEELNSIAPLIKSTPKLESAFKKLGVTFQDNQAIYTLDNPLNTYLFLPRIGNCSDLTTLTNEGLAEIRDCSEAKIETIIRSIDAALTLDAINAKAHELVRAADEVLVANKAKAEFSTPHAERDKSGSAEHVFQTAFSSSRAPAADHRQNPPASDDIDRLRSDTPMPSASLLRQPLRF